jgi:hypothetical protein
VALDGAVGRLPAAYDNFDARDGERVPPRTCLPQVSTLPDSRDNGRAVKRMMCGRQPTSPSPVDVFGCGSAPALAGVLVAETTRPASSIRWAAGPPSSPAVVAQTCWAVQLVPGGLAVS